MRRIYSFILSYITYANVAWASTNVTKPKKLFGKQKQAARITFNQDRFKHTHPFLKILNALNVYQIKFLQVLMFMYLCQILHSCTCSGYLEQLFKWNWKKTYYRSISLNKKSKERYLNLKKKWASFKHRKRIK